MSTTEEKSDVLLLVMGSCFLPYKNNNNVALGIITIVGERGVPLEVSQ